MVAEGDASERREPLCFDFVNGADQAGRFTDIVFSAAYCWKKPAMALTRTNAEDWDRNRHMGEARELRRTCDDAALEP